ncbi:MAG: YceI family protein [Sterolibacteriaceae bacterium]|uniref:YceI family protein n=1 Tax=Candidatus Methylophosphatis roskildensis TaxID=2899263 RepID=A0A9D7HN34_9PROT|nr:YceI family protein [Candidatus Methylophosphatis roskildensis]
MMGSKVLDAAPFPEIEIRTVDVIGPSWAPDVTLRIRLKGVERDMTVPVAIQYANNRLEAITVFEVKQTDFGISPLSILGGALQVADAIRVRMRIVAEKS